MKLTGKAKEQFEKWYVTNKYHEQFFLRDVHQSDFADYFEDLPKSMRWGVYQDWADSLGYSLGCVWNRSVLKYFPKLRMKTSYDDLIHWHPQDSVEQARNAAIEKLNELIKNT